MAQSTLTTLANMLRSNYGSLITDAIVRRGPAAANLIPQQSLLGLLAEKGRVFMGADGAAPFGDKAAYWPVHSATAAAASYGQGDAFAAATAETLAVASLDWKRLAITLEVDNLARIAARGNSVVGNEAAYAFEFKAKVRSLLSELEDQLAEDGTGNSGKDVTGFQAFMTDSSTSYAGINMTTSAYWQAAEVDASAAALDADLLRELIRDMDVKGARPSAFLLGSTQYHKLQQTLDSKIQYLPQQGSNGEISAVVGSFEGIPIYQINTMNDSTRANNEVWAVDFNEIELRFLPQDVPDQGVDGEAADFMGYPIGIEPLSTTDDSSKLAIKCYAQLICLNPARQGCIINLSTTI